MPLPAAVRAEIQAGTLAEIEVRLCLDSVFVPAEIAPGSTDRRSLGVAVERLWLA